MSQALVGIKDLHKVFQRGGERIEVLQGVDLEIPSGDFLALMGPSGSGKTTLLNLMGGLDTPSGGSITVGSDRIDSMSGGKLSAWRARHIGFVFQMYNLLPVLTAARNVELPLLLTKLSKAERRKRVEVALRQARQIRSVDRQATRARRIETTDQVEQRRLAGARRTGEHHERASLDLQVHTAQRSNGHSVIGICFFSRLDGDDDVVRSGHGNAGNTGKRHGQAHSKNSLIS